MSTNTEPSEPGKADSPAGDAAAVPEDAVLLQAARRGDHAAFETFVRRHERIVCGYLRSRLAGAADVEDLAQEAFLRVYSGRATQRDESRTDLRPWLLGVARNVLREHVRRLRRRREVAWTELCLEIEELSAADGDLGRYDEAIARLPVCLDGLGPSARQAIDLYYHAELSMRDIADRFKRSEGAVKLLVHRARLAVKRCLDGAAAGGVA